MDGSRSLCVAVAGGTGRLGRRLTERLSRRFEVRVLSRRPAQLEERESHHPGAPGLSTVRCDLLSVPQTEVALAGADVLVHLARPSAAACSSAGTSPADLAWLMADSVARAAPRTSVTRIVTCATELDEPSIVALRASGLPVAVARTSGAGAVPDLDELEALVWAPESTDRELPPAVDGVAPRGDEQARPRELPPAAEREVAPASEHEPAGAPSVQRHALPPGWGARDVAEAYFAWLGAQVPLVRTERRDEAWVIRAIGLPALRLRFSPGACRPGSHVFDVSDGSLLRSGSVGARFEFRIPLGSDVVFTVLHGFAPRLPWGLYRVTQAPLHAATMRAFGRSLEARAR